MIGPALNTSVIRKLGISLGGGAFFAPTHLDGVGAEIMTIQQALVGWASRLLSKAGPQPRAMGRLDEVMGRLLETWAGRYAFDFDRERLVIKFTKGEMLAVADLMEGKIRVAYESATDALVEELCNVEQAVALIDVVMARTVLCRVSTNAIRMANRRHSGPYSKCDGAAGS